MAKHEVVIHENTGATKDVAPYLGSYIAKETVKEGVFANSIALLCGMSAVQVTAILDGAFEAIEELERGGLVRVHTDIGVICGIITGSFPTSDAPFDPEENTLELALRIDEAIRLALADVVPTIIADENLTKLRVDNVMDLVTPRPYNLIHGKHVFRVAGFNMELTDEGATVYLQDKHGATFPLVIDEAESKQLFKAHTGELLEAGDYKLIVKSRAGDAEGPLQTAFRRVKYLEVVDPAPTIDSVEVICLGEPEMGYHLKVHGENLRGVEEGPEEYGGYPIHALDAKLFTPDGDEVALTPDEGVANVETDRKLVNACLHGEDRLVDGTGYTLKIVLADTAGNPVTLEKTFTYSEE